VVPQDFERPLAGRRLEHLAVALEDHADRFAHARLVVDHEHRAARRTLGAARRTDVVGHARVACNAHAASRLQGNQTDSPMRA